MRLGLVADTHRPSRLPVFLPSELLRGLAGCDLILHLGDFNSLPVLERLRELGPVLGVYGNNDDAELIALLPRERYLQIGAWKLGMLHGHEGPGVAREVALREMKDRVDCVVYGHSHWPDNTRREGLLMVNPGSPTQRRRAPARTFAIMTVDDEIAVTHIELTQGT
jgi:hypothetical protein